MRYLDPLPWHLVAPATVVLIAGVPRCVFLVRGDVDGITVYAQGLAPFRPDGAYAQPVELEESDAIGNMLRAGLTLTPIKEE